MKKEYLSLIHLLCFSLLVCTIDLNAQSTYFEHLNGPNGGRVTCIAVNNNGDIYAGLGFGQGMYKSADNAASWSYVGDLGDNSIADIKIKSNGEIFVATQYNLYHSTDNGNTWQLLTTINHIIDYIAVNNNKIYLSAGTFMYSLNGGSTIIQTNMEASNEIAVNSNGIVFAGSMCGAGIFKTADDGNTFNVCPVNNCYIGPIVIDSSDAVYAGAYTSTGGIYKSTDVGNTWFRIDSGFINNDIVDLTLNKHGDLFALTSSQGFYVLYHNTTNWIPLSLNVPAAYTICYDNSHNQVIAGSYGGGVYVSSNPAFTWSKKSDGITAYFLNNMFFTSQNILYVNTQTSTYKSSDLGNTWTELNLPFTSYSSTAEDHDGNIYILSENKGYFKSSDNGLTWAQNDTGFIFNQCKDIVVDSNNYIYIGDLRYGVYRSTDEGTTWLNINSGMSDSSIWALCTTHNHSLLAGALMSDKGFYRSTNAGLSWAPATNSLNPFYWSIIDFALLKDNTIFAISLSDSSYISRDDGQSWSALISQDHLDDIISDINGKLYALKDGNILFSNDTGNIWQPFNSSVHAIKLVIDSSGVIFAGGLRGIYRSTDSTLNITYNSESIQFNPQVFPNPATDNITIECQQQSQYATFDTEISNLQGQLIKSLSKCKNKTSVNISAFPAGIYLIKVTNDKGVIVKKFIKQ